MNAECSMNEDVSTMGDAYNFGVLLLEMITGSSLKKKKSDGANLHDFVGRAFPTNIHEIGDSIKGRCITLLTRIGQVCTEISLSRPLSCIVGEFNKPEIQHQVAAATAYCAPTLISYYFRVAKIALMCWPFLEIEIYTILLILHEQELVSTQIKQVLHYNPIHNMFL